MENNNITKKIKMVFDSAVKAQGYISKLKPEEKANLEKDWDIEHAYYSSSLEGSRIDRKDFEEIGKQVA